MKRPHKNNASRYIFIPYSVSLSTALHISPAFLYWIHPHTFGCFVYIGKSVLHRASQRLRTYANRGKAPSVHSPSRCITSQAHCESCVWRVCPAASQIHVTVSSLDWQARLNVPSSHKSKHLINSLTITNNSTFLISYSFFALIVSPMQLLATRKALIILILFSERQK